MSEVRIAILLLLVMSTAVRADEAAKSATQLFRITPKSVAEKFFLVEAEKSPIDPGNQHLGLGRVAFPDGHFTYRIPLVDVSACTLNMEIGNRYKISISSDNKNWRKIAEVRDVSGLSNWGTFPFDLAPVLPADQVYVKFEDSQNVGWGCWLASVTVLADRAAARPVMMLDASGNERLRFDLDSVLVRGERALQPANATSVEVTYHSGVLRGRFVCGFTEGYSPVSVAKNRDGDVYRDDCVEIFVGRADNPTDYRHFVINSANVQLDELGYDHSQNWEWESRTETRESDWVADFVIDLRKTGLEATEGDALLLCASRLDGSSGQVAIPTPFSGWGLHRPQDWVKVVLGDRSDALPAFSYDGDREILQLEENARDEKLLFMVLDSQNHAVFSDAIDPGVSYSAPLQFEKPGTYTVYSYTESGLASRSSLTIAEEVVDKFTADIVAPIFYTGETVRIGYSIPERARGQRVRATVASGDKPVDVAVQDQGSQLQIVGLDPGEYVVTLVLAGVDDMEPVSKSFVIKKPTSIPEKVAITPAGYVTVDGEFYAPIMVHIPQNLEDVRDRGFNVVVSGDDNPRDPEWIEKNRRLLDDSHALGLKVLLHLCNLFRGDNEDLEALKLVVSSLKHHPGLFGWFTADEPSGNLYDVSRLDRAYRVIKAIDKDHPVVVLDNVPIMLKTYAPYCDILSSDPYPVPSSPLHMVADWTKTTLQASTTGCIYMVLQGQGPPYYSRQPTFEEEKIMLQHALENGAKSIGWWAHGAMASSGYWERYSDLTAMAREYILKRAK